MVLGPVPRGAHGAFDVDPAAHVAAGRSEGGWWGFPWGFPWPTLETKGFFLVSIVDESLTNPIRSWSCLLLMWEIPALPQSILACGKIHPRHICLEIIYYPKPQMFTVRNCQARFTVNYAMGPTVASHVPATLPFLPLLWRVFWYLTAESRRMIIPKFRMELSFSAPCFYQETHSLKAFLSGFPGLLGVDGNKQVGSALDLVAGGSP